MAGLVTRQVTLKWVAAPDPGRPALLVGIVGDSRYPLLVLQLDQVSRAIDLQARAYQLLRWVEQAFEAGFIVPETAHRYASFPDAAFGWIAEHYENLPHAARPERENLLDFSRFFGTFLDSTFDLDTNPGERLYSPDAHCFCPHCSWMVRVPHLRPKKLGPADKKAAAVLMRQFLRRLASELELTLSEQALDRLAQAADLREQLGLCTYTSDLLDRLAGISVGPASLALWRTFAWTAQGSPKKNFALETDDVMAAQRALIERLTSLASLPPDIQ